MREIVQTSQFKKDLKKIASSGRYRMEDFLSIVEKLTSDVPLAQKNRDHALSNNWQDYRECHIKPDWLLIYKKYEQVLLLARMGSHSELF